MIYEILEVGGTVARLIVEGYEVFTLMLGEGITSRNKNRDIDKRGFAQIMPIFTPIVAVFFSAICDKSIDIF